MKPSIADARLAQSLVLELNFPLPGGVYQSRLFDMLNTGLCDSDV
jgi:hypothetical protein